MSARPAPVIAEGTAYVRTEYHDGRYIEGQSDWLPLLAYEDLAHDEDH